MLWIYIDLNSPSLKDKKPLNAPIDKPYGVGFLCSTVGDVRIIEYCNTSDQAAERVHYLNGGDSKSTTSLQAQGAPIDIKMYKALLDLISSVGTALRAVIAHKPDLTHADGIAIYCLGYLIHNIDAETLRIPDFSLKDLVTSNLKTIEGRHKYKIKDFISMHHLQIEELYEH